MLVPSPRLNPRFRPLPPNRIHSGVPMDLPAAGPARTCAVDYPARQCGEREPARVERRLRDLEDKMDRLLKELESLKGEKKDKEKKNSDKNESSHKARPDNHGRRTISTRIGS